MKPESIQKTMTTNFPTCKCGSQDFDRITKEYVTMSLTWEDGQYNLKETDVRCTDSHIECAKCHEIIMDEEQMIEEFFW